MKDYLANLPSRVWMLLAVPWQAQNVKVLRSDLSTEELKSLLKIQYKRPWNIHIARRQSKRQFLRYAGRYIRRPPIAQHRIRGITDREVEFLAKDTRQKRWVISRCPIEEFVALLAEHVPDRYRHAIRYFGLLAPGPKARTSGALFALLGQKRLPRPRRLRWADSRRRETQR